MKNYYLGMIGFAAAMIASSANAADLRAPVNKAPAMAPAAYNWTGCYLGISGGGNWGSSRVTSASGEFSGLPITNDFDLSGGLLGGTVGCNYQVGSWVFGVENDLSWTNKTGTGRDIPPFNVAATNELKEKWIDTLRGRAGFAWDRAFLYATGGVAFAGTSLTVCGPGACANDSQTRTGWTLGAGLEYAVWENVSLKLEYLHVDFGTDRYMNPAITVPGVGTFDTRDVRLTDDIVRAGVNWRFSSGGLFGARY